MNKDLARHLTILIAKDLISIRKDLPSFIYETIEQYFVDGKFDQIEEFLKSWINGPSEKKVDVNV